MASGFPVLLFAWSDDANPVWAPFISVDNMTLRVVFFFPPCVSSGLNQLQYEGGSKLPESSRLPWRALLNSCWMFHFMQPASSSISWKPAWHLLLVSLPDPGIRQTFLRQAVMFLHALISRRSHIPSSGQTAFSFLPVWNSSALWSCCCDTLFSWCPWDGARWVWPGLTHQAVLCP